MGAFKIDRVDSALESRIVLACLTNDQFLREVKHAIDLGYFKNTHHQRLVKYSLRHFEAYETALGKEGCRLTIDGDRTHLTRDGEYDNLIELADTLFARVTEGHKENTPYLVAQAIKYFKKRELEITCNNITFHLEEDKVDEAEKALNEYIKIEKRFSDSNDPLDEAPMQEYFSMDNKEFFRMPGDLGRFLGNMERGWLVGIMGKYKGGKSWCAMEFAVQGMLSGLNVAFFSLEMTTHKMYERIIKRLIVAGDSGEVINPIFDCKKNQNDECQLPRRTNDIALDWQPGEVLDFRKNSNYHVCTFCRNKFPQHFEPATWFEKATVPIFDQQTVAEARIRLHQFYKGRFKFKSYPRYTASIEDIKNDLNILEVTEGWIPDIIVVDYADILKPEPGSPVEGHEKEDRTWIALSTLAGEKHALVVAPTQVTKDGLEAFMLSTKHTARWSGKLGHVDMMLTINQTEEEKRSGALRIAIMEHRHHEFYETASCIVLQNLKTAQVHLDSVKSQIGGE
jgi:hypothetical protein